MIKADKNAEIPMGDEQEPHVEQPRFYRTVFNVEVLSEVYEGNQPVSKLKLNDVVYEITEGHCSGVYKVESEIEVTPQQMAKLLIAQGSDPGFFMLDKEGNPIDEDEEK